MNWRQFQIYQRVKYGYRVGQPGRCWVAEPRLGVNLNADEIRVNGVDKKKEKGEEEKEEEEEEEEEEEGKIGN